MILTWERPRKVMTDEEYAAISADSAPPGVYSGNMSRDDARKWRAQKIGGANPRVVIRKTVSGDDPAPPHSKWRIGCFAQLKIVVFPDGSVKMSQNGAAVYTPQDWQELEQAVAEGIAALA